MRLRNAVCIAALIGLAGSLLLSRGADAHAVLKQSIPADRAQLTRPPDHVELEFSEHLVLNRTGTFALVYGPAGAQVSEEAHIDGREGTRLIVPLRGQLDAGAYVVFWKTTSEDDGGVSLGNIVFTIGQGEASAATAAGNQVLIPDSQRDRALAAPSPRSSGDRGWLIVLGMIGSALLGAVLTYFVLRARQRHTAADRSGQPGRRRGGGG